MKYKVFIQSNSKQYLGALVSKYTIERYSSNLDKFAVEILSVDEISEIKNIFNKEILKDGKKIIYSQNDLQSFTLSRFLPPQLMNFEGRSIVIDPDVFSVYTDIWDLFKIDMGSYAALMRRHNVGWGTSVMLINNKKFKHWKIEEMVNDLIKHKVDYRDLMCLRNEIQKIGVLDNVWNSYDTLSDKTKLLHNTLRITQPWRVGLKIDYIPKRMKPLFGIIPRELIHMALGRNPYIHREHPDKNQTNFFFSHLKSAIIEEKISINLVEKEIINKNLRPDAIKILNKVKPA